jgi:hypothetical protein
MIFCLLLAVGTYRAVFNYGKILSQIQEEYILGAESIRNFTPTYLVHVLNRYEAV